MLGMRSRSCSSRGTGTRAAPHPKKASPKAPQPPTPNLEGDVGDPLPQLLQPPPRALVQKPQRHVKGGAPPDLERPGGREDARGRVGGFEQVVGAHAGGQEGLVGVAPGVFFWGGGCLGGVLRGGRVGGFQEVVGARAGGQERLVGGAPGGGQGSGFGVQGLGF